MSGAARASLPVGGAGSVAGSRVEKIKCGRRRFPVAPYTASAWIVTLSDTEAGTRRLERGGLERGGLERADDSRSSRERCCSQLVSAEARGARPWAPPATTCTAACPRRTTAARCSSAPITKIRSAGSGCVGSNVDPYPALRRSRNSTSRRYTVPLGDEFSVRGTYTHYAYPQNPLPLDYNHDEIAARCPIWTCWRPRVVPT